MANTRRKTPDLFNENELDPVETATGYPQTSPGEKAAAASGPSGKAGAAADMTVKKKAGFYLSVHILNRFTHKFHELKLAGVAIDNKSTLLEAALGFALDDMDKGEGSEVLQKLGE